jgi:diguanylate cyclase (GGDEF)-like protein/PAS domain S-box-containing protein
MAVPVVVVDPQGRIQSLNRAAVRDLGLTRDSIGTPLQLPSEPILSSTIGRYVQATAASGRPEGFHIRLREKDTFVHLRPAHLLVTVSFTGIPEILTFSKRLDQVRNKLQILSRRHKALIESMPAEIAILDSRGHVSAVNQAWRRFVQHGSESTVRKHGIGSHYLDVLVDARLADGTAFSDLRAGLERILSGQTQRFTLDYRLPAAGPAETPERWRRVTISAPTVGGDGAVALHEDIGNEVEWSRQVLLHQAALHCVPSAILMVNASGVIAWANDACQRMYGFHDGELAGQSASILAPDARHQREFLEVLQSCRSSGLPHSLETMRLARGGRSVTIQETVTPLPLNPAGVGVASTPAQFVVVHDDLTRSRHVESQLPFLTRHDNLTGLWTRQTFHERLHEAVERQTRKHGVLAVLFLDLDRLKDTNDTLGHTAGDQVLIEVVRRVRGCVPEPSGVGRFGGDELAIFCEDLTGVDQLTAIVESLYRSVESPVEIASRQVFLSVSIGVALCPRDGTNAEKLLRNAGLAVHRAKSEGRRGYFSYDPELESATHLRISVERDLNRAIGAKELWVAYQPQYNLRTGELTGVEALLRWNRTTHYAVTIGQVVTIAEEAGLILPIGHWMLKETMSSLQRWHMRGHRIRLAVNLSAVQFHRQDVFGILTGIARRRSLPSWAVKAEITETALLQNSARSREILYALHGAGYGLVLDDFGTGYSSLTYLQQFPIEALKIDSSFLRGIGQDRQNETIVTGIIQLAHALGQTVIAEGVEDYEQLEFLKRHNCDYAQGFLLGHPMPEAAFEELLLTKAAGA